MINLHLLNLKATFFYGTRNAKGKIIFDLFFFCNLENDLIDSIARQCIFVGLSCTVYCSVQESYCNFDLDNNADTATLFNSIQLEQSYNFVFNHNSIIILSYTITVDEKPLRQKIINKYGEGMHVCTIKPHTTWWGLNIIEKKSSRIAESGFEYLRVCSFIVQSQ